MTPSTLTLNWLEWAADLPPLPDFLLKATIILLLGWMGTLALRGRNPYWRVFLWRCVVAAVLVLPVVYFMTPKISLVVAEASAGQPSTERPVDNPLEKQLQRSDSNVSMPSFPESGEQLPPAPSGTVHLEPVDIRTSQATGDQTSLNQITRPGIMENRHDVWWIWGLGIALLLFRMFFSHWKVRRFVRESQPGPLEVVCLVEQVARDLRLRGRIEVRTSSILHTPFLTGVLRPVLLLPDEMTATGYREDLPAVLAHELSHVRTLDLVWGWVFHLTGIVLWPHPLIWWVRKSHMAACEEVCDAAAANYIGSMENYSGVLARVAYALHSSPPAACGIAMARVSNVSRRLAALKRFLLVRPLSKKRIAVGLVVSFSVLFLIAALDFVRAEPEAVAPQVAAAAPNPELEKQEVASTVPKLKLRLVNKATQAVIANTTVEMSLNVNGGCGNYVDTPFRTGPDGEAALVSTATNPVAFGFRASIPGYVPMGGMWYRESEPRIASMPSFALVEFEKGNAIGGVVKDETGNPVAGVNVEVRLNRDLEEELKEPIGYFMKGLGGTTNSEGRWICDGIPQSLDGYQLSLLFSHPEYVLECIWNIASPAEISRLRAGPYEVVLKKGSSFSGWVVDEFERPIEGATVRVGRYSEAKETKTDVDGTFLLDHVPDHPTTLVVTKHDYAPVAVTASPGAKSPKLQVELKHGMPLRGRVVDEEGNAIEGVQIRLDNFHSVSPLEGMLENWSEETDDNGRFEWVDSPSQTLHISVSKDGYQEVRQLQLTPSASEHLITLRPAIKVSGRVLDEASMKPIEDFELIPGIQSREDSKKIDWQDFPWSRRRFHDGTYEYLITESRPGIALKAKAKGYLPAESPIIHRDASREIEHDFLLVKGSGPCGKVLDLEGKPLSGTSVILCTADTRGYLRNGLDASLGLAYPLTTDEEGKFEFSEPASGFIVYCVHKNGFATVPSEDFSEGADIQIKPWGRVEGQVFIGSKPAPSQSVELVYPYEDDRNRERIDLEYETTTDSEGRFLFEYAFPGKPRVARKIVLSTIGIGIDERRTHFTPVEIQPGETSTVQIGGNGRPVIGKLQLPSGFEGADKVKWDLADGSLSVPYPTERKGFLAQLFGLESSLERRRRIEQKYYFKYRTGVVSDGTFRFEDIPEGTYNLHFRIPNPQHPWEEPSFGTVESNLTVPPMAGGRSDEPLDLGILEVTMTGK